MYHALLGSLELCHEVLRVASRVMKKKGTVVMKIFQGRGTEEFIKSLRKPTAHASNAATAHTHTDADAHATDGLSARTSEGGRGGKQRSKRGDRGIRKQVPNEKKYKKVKANLDHLDDDDDDEEDDDEEEDDGDNHADDSSSGTKLSTRAVKGERGRSTRGEGEGEGCVHGAGGAYRHGVPVLPLQFDMVKVVKPKASRKRSVEVFIVARNH